MTEPIHIYHNPRCSKSRQTLERVRDAGFEPEVIDYKKSGVTLKELKRILRLLGTDAHAIVRSKEAAYGEQGLSQASSDAQILEAIHARPELLERPIVVRGDQAAIGRPPENVDALLD